MSIRCQQAPLVVVALVHLSAGAALSQELGPLDRERGRTMLRVVSSRIQRGYYDSTYHGINFVASVARADSQIRLARFNSEIFEIIARVVMQLDDSHTWFIPPRRAATVDYGWGIQMIGDSGFVVRVEPGSDAATQGLAVGDRIVAIDGWEPNHRDFHHFEYFYSSLSPRGGVRLIVEPPAGGRRVLDVAARIQEGKRLFNLWGPDLGVLIREAEDSDRRWRDEFGRVGAVAIWRMGWFGGSERMDDGMKRAHNAAALIVDLRANPGGFEESWLRLAGRFVERETRVGIRRRRSRTDTIVVRPRGPRFAGKLIVLVDSRSASASELFARFVQQEGCGIVIGDRSAGLVVRSIYHSLSIGGDILVPYGVSVSDADIMMADGVRLEKRGVVPDERVVPTGADLAAGRDPAMARALALAGHPLDAAAAGRVAPRVERN